MYTQETVISAPNQLQDMFVRLTPGLTAKEQYEKHGDQLAEMYENKKLLYIDNYPFEFDRELMWSLPIIGPKEIPHSLLKMKIGGALAPITKPFNDQTHILGNFVKPAEKAFAMQDMIKSIQQQLQQIARDMFPMYKPIEEDRGFSIRLTCQAGEEIHFDSYAGMDDGNHRVRIFANLDCRPRIWSTGGLFENWIDKFDDALIIKGTSHHPNKANEFLNEKIDWDKHGDLAYMMFAPLSVWFVDSQPVSHEIVYGRRMASQTTVIDPATVLHPEKMFHVTAKELWRKEYQKRAVALGPVKLAQLIKEEKLKEAVAVKLK